MNVLRLSTTAIAISCIGSVHADEKKPKKVQYVDTEQQPWSEYKVHDMERPHPPKVNAPGCVSVPAPAGATVLFDGSDTSAFKGGWDIVDGAMVANKTGGVSTKESFGSCHLHLEWRVPAGRKVNGQKGGNSGVFMMGRYEVQIQESYANVTYADGQAAAIYGQSPPQVNASLPQGEWNSYDIIFEAPKYGKNGVEREAYMTIVHNGVVVHSHQIVYGPTSHKKAAKYPLTHSEKAPFSLQWHSDPIEFRNIWIQSIEK